MALTHRSAQRVSGSIWPGFVDAMAALLLVLIFLLTIFMFVQAVLRETITGQESELGDLSAEVLALSEALGLSKQEATQLRQSVATLQGETDRQATLIADLTGQIDAQAYTLLVRDEAIASFEEQIAALLIERDSALEESRTLESVAAQLRVDVAAREASLMQALAALEQSEITEAETAALLVRALADIEARDASLAEARAALEQSEISEAETAALLVRALADVEERDVSLAQALAALKRSEISEAETAALLARALADIEARDASLAEARAALDQSEISEAETAALLVRALADIEARDVSLAQALAALEQSEVTEAETAALLVRALADIEARDASLAQALAALDKSEATEAETAALLARALADVAARDASLAEARAALEQSEMTEAETAALLARALADVEAREASLSDALAALARSEAAGAETAASLAGTRERLRDAAAEAEQLREALAAALAARLAAEGAGAAAVDERDRRQALLDAAGRRLAAEREISSRAQREVALLNAQVAALRGQLAELSRLLDGAAARDRASRVRIDALGSRLNQALARAAAEQRRRAALEAAEAARLRRAKAALDEEVVDLAAYRSEFFGTLRRVLGDREGVRIVGDRFLFSSEVLFESGSATLRPEGRASIAEVAGILEEVADEIPANLDWVLRVDGHTDSAPVVVAGAFADNWELSAGRALSVVKYMTGTLGFPPERLAAAGFGEYRPVNPEDTDAARAQNRRIELKLTER